MELCRIAMFELLTLWMKTVTKIMSLGEGPVDFENLQTRQEYTSIYESYSTCFFHPLLHQLATAPKRGIKIEGASDQRTSNPHRNFKASRPSWLTISFPRPTARTADLNLLSQIRSSSSS